MKRLYFFFVAFLIVSCAWAGPRLNAAILVESQRGEYFQLAIGGRVINPVAQNRVAVGDLPAGRHLVDVRVMGRGYRSQRIRAEVILRDGYETVFVLTPIRRGRNLMLRKVEELPLHQPAPQPPAPDPVTNPDICRYIMNEEDINRTIRFMKEEGFDDRRLEIAKGEIRLAGGILTDDLYLLLKEIRFEDRRIALAKYAYNYVCDQQKFSRVFDAFEFPSSRREMQDFLYSR